jgi:hypothetical protein
MSRELSPTSVSRRLAVLRALYVPETEARAARSAERAEDFGGVGGRAPDGEEQVRAHLAPEATRDSSFAQGVARRLAELRALSDLTAYLHRASLPGSSRRRE